MHASGAACRQPCRALETVNATSQLEKKVGRGEEDAHDGAQWGGLATTSPSVDFVLFPLGTKLCETSLLYCSAVLHLVWRAYMDGDALLCTNQPANLLIFLKSKNYSI
jgi:hypothetical protein